MISVQVRIKCTAEGFTALNREMAEYNRLMARDGGKPIVNFVVRVGNGTGDQDPCLCLRLHGGVRVRYGQDGGGR